MFLVTFIAKMIIHRFHGNGHAYRIEGVLIAWVCVPITKIGTFSEIDDYAWHNFLSGYREILNFYSAFVGSLCIQVD